MQTITKAVLPGPLHKGEWRLWGLDAMVACPRCGVTKVYAVWEIANDGGVALKCLSCAFNEMVRLEGWTPG